VKVKGKVQSSVFVLLMNSPAHAHGVILFKRENAGYKHKSTYIIKLPKTKTPRAFTNKNKMAYSDSVAKMRLSEIKRAAKCSVFSSRLKAIGDGNKMISDGRPFQTRAAETAKLVNIWRSYR